MARDNVFNFSAGPSVMPLPALESARDQLPDYMGSGVSVMEMSHRSKQFQEIFDSTKLKLRTLMQVPETHDILFLQGGATLQFAAIPMNLLEGGCADYAITGNFSKKAAQEAEKYGSVHIACDSSPTGHDRIPSQEELDCTEVTKYFYYCANNTVYGTEWQYVPRVSAPLVCDMSSDILSYPVDVSRFGLIYAGAQKNMAPAGLTVVIVDKSLLGREMAITPQVMSYKILSEHDSMLNTPPCWCIYMLGLTLDWVRAQGGVEAMDALRRERAALLYDFLDNSRLFKAHALPGSRSFMNVTFSTGNSDLDAEFVKASSARGFLNLKGHKVAGGMRASIYNAMPVEGVKKLVNYMKEFELSHV